MRLSDRFGRVFVLITFLGINDKLAAWEELPYFCMSQSDT
jgi:hypothetical protein